MKIVIVGTAFPLRGGIAHFNALLAAHLGKRHTVETVTFKRQYPSFLFPGKTQEEQGGGSHDFPIEPAPQWIDSINPVNWITAGKRIAAMKPDLLIFKYWLPFFGPCFGTIARTVKRATGAKVLFICDNIIPHERRPGDVAFTRYAFGAGDFFIVQSDAVERDLKQHFPGARYAKVAHPVYDIFGTPIPKGKAREILGVTASHVALFFGYIRTYKGLNVLLDAFAKYRAVTQGTGLHDAQLLVVGEFYDDEQKYRSQAAKLKLGESVRFVSDYVPNDAVAAYFSAADVAVLPYLSATQSGITQIAYNFGTPVIATNVGGLAEVVLDNVTGFIVPPENPDALADALKRFFESGRGPEFSANVAVERKKYSWDNLTDSIEQLYDASRAAASH